jgi:hypothetical protein
LRHTTTSLEMFFFRACPARRNIYYWSPLLLYYCFFTPSSLLLLYSCFTPALLLLHLPAASRSAAGACHTPALLLLYCCFTTPLLVHLRAASGAGSAALLSSLLPACSPYVSIRQPYVSIRQQYISKHQHTPAYVSMRQHT